MDLHYAGYFNPATAAMPHAPLLVVLLLPTLIWLAVRVFRVKRRHVLSAICAAYGLYALLVAHEYWYILDWRRAASHPENYPIAEGHVAAYREKQYLPSACAQPTAGIFQFTKGSDDIEQRFDVAHETFVAHHKRQPILDFFIPRLSVPQLPLAAGARVRITYRPASHGKEFLNVEIETNDVTGNWCDTFPMFLPSKTNNPSLFNH
jgi:hypothetical protein